MSLQLRKLLLYFRRLTQKIGFWVSLYAVLAGLTAFAGVFIGPMLPAKLVDLVKPGDVTPILSILASSMLAVSTFSLNVMVSARNAATDRTTPRIHRLILQDQTTQLVLSVFIGAFIYSLTALILLNAGPDPDKMAVIVMAVTIFVVLLVVIALLRWISHLSDFGSLENSLAIAVRNAESSLRMHAKYPALRGVPLTEDTVLPQAGTMIAAHRSGYIQVVDIASMAESLSGSSFAYVTHGPGQHVLEGQPVALVSGQVTPAQAGRIADCFVIGATRTSEQDPEFGIMTLSETASHALSPGINDPGTAIEAIERLSNLLWGYANSRDQAEEPEITRVFVRVPSADQLIRAAFAAAARDGAGTIEVAIDLRRALLALSQSRDKAIGAAAEAMAGEALDYSSAALILDAEKQRLKSVKPMSLEKG